MTTSIIEGFWHNYCFLQFLPRSQLILDIGSSSSHNIKFKIYVNWLIWKGTPPSELNFQRIDFDKLRGTRHAFSITELRHITSTFITRESSKISLIVLFSSQFDDCWKTLSPSTIREPDCSSIGRSRDSLWTLLDTVSFLPPEYVPRVSLTLGTV